MGLVFGRELLIIYSENLCLKSSSLCSDMDNIYMLQANWEYEYVVKYFFKKCEMCIAPCCKVPIQGDGVGWGATN